MMESKKAHQPPSCSNKRPSLVSKLFHFHPHPSSAKKAAANKPVEEKHREKPLFFEHSPRLSFVLAAAAPFGFKVGVQRFVVLLRISLAWALGLRFFLERRFFLGLATAVLSHAVLDFFFCRGHRRRLLFFAALGLYGVFSQVDFPIFSGRARVEDWFFLSAFANVTFNFWLLCVNARAGLTGALSSSLLSASLAFVFFGSGFFPVFFLSMFGNVLFAPLAKSTVLRLRGRAYIDKGHLHSLDQAFMTMLSPKGKTATKKTTTKSQDDDHDDEQDHRKTNTRTRHNPPGVSSDDENDDTKVEDVDDHVPTRPTAESFFALDTIEHRRRANSLIAGYEPRKR